MGTNAPGASDGYFDSVNYNASLVPYQAQLIDNPAAPIGLRIVLKAALEPGQEIACHISSQKIGLTINAIALGALLGRTEAVLEERYPPSDIEGYLKVTLVPEAPAEGSLQTEAGYRGYNRLIGVTVRFEPDPKLDPSKISPVPTLPWNDIRTLVLGIMEDWAQVRLMPVKHFSGTRYQPPLVRTLLGRIITDCAQLILVLVRRLSGMRHRPPSEG